MSRCLPSFLCLALALPMLGSLATQRAVAAAASGVVTLPPFLVEASRDPPWRYARSPEFEILARCADDTTREIAQNYHRLHLLLKLVLPPAFHVKHDVPRILILCDRAHLPANAEQMLAEMRRTANVPPAADERRRVVMDNPQLSDKDGTAAFRSVPPGSRESFTLPRGDLILGSEPEDSWSRLTPGYVNELLGGRTPALPAWFVSGFAALYGRMHCSEDALEAGAMPRPAERGPRDRRGDEEWLKLPPELFAGPGGATNIDRWFVEAELLVRWALDDSNRSRREAFWQFVDRASREPVDEAVFTACFGADYRWLAEQLRAYLPLARRRPARWLLKQPVALPEFAPRDATDGEICRLKGEWERLATRFVRANLPEFAPLYLAQTRRTLRRSYDLGDRDPRLLASLGLCECDAGNADGGREFLELAAQGGVVRPRVYLELARLRFAEARARPAEARGKLSSVQAADVVKLLTEARRQAPPLRETYWLMADVWAASAAAPAPEHLGALGEGVEWFPQDSELRYRTAVLFLKHDRTAEALKLAATGARLATDEATRERFTALPLQFGRQ